MKKYILILALILLTSSVHAITLSNPVSVALGGAYIAKARGFESLHWNPANLGMVENFMTFNLFQVSSDVRNTTLTLGYYNDLMGKLLNKQDKEEFLNKIPESGLSLNANVGTHLPVSMSIGKVAVTFNTMVRSSAEVSKQYFDLILHGNELGVTYDMQGNRGRAVAFLEAKVGYGDRIPMEKISSSFEDLPPIYGGVSFGFIHGMGYAQILEFESQFATNDTAMTVYNNLLIRTAGYDTEKSEFYAASVFPGAGFGYRMNVGLTSTITENVTASLAIKNLFGKIDWTESCEEHEIQVNAFDLTIDSWSDTLTVDTTYAIDGFTQTIPIELHIGGSYKWNSIGFYADYVQGFKRSLFTSARGKFSVGAEYYPITWLPLRAGFGFGGGERAHFSLGTGLDFSGFNFDWAVSYYTSPIYTTATGIKLSFGAELAF